MSKRDSFEIRKKILYFVKENSLTFAQLERKVNTNSITIRKDCEELKYYKLVSIEKKKHPANGKMSYFVKITDRGREVIT